MVLDPVFMFIFKFGFVGAGFATLTGQIIACISLTMLAKRNGNIPVSLKNVKCSKKEHIPYSCGRNAQLFKASNYYSHFIE